MKLKNLLHNIVVFAFSALLSTTLTAQDQSAPVPFQELPKETQDMLAPFAKNWHEFKPARQQRILARAQSSDPEQRARFKNLAERVKNLSKEDRKRLRKAKKHFDKMPPHERNKLRQRFENMSPAEHQKLKNKYKKFKGMPAHKQKEIRDRVRNMSAEERRQYLDELKQSDNSK